MTLRFGTDGIRGVADLDLTSEVVAALGRAMARALPVDRGVCIARDTRASGPRLESALAAGLTAEAVDVELLGVLPTPALASAARERRASGAAISASHNPPRDNGIKCFTPDGTKLDDDREAFLERELAAIAEGGAGPAGGGARVAAARGAAGAGSVREADGAGEAYVSHLLEGLEGRRLDGLRLVVDCANGAASAVAPRAFRLAGADVVALADAPDGSNINDHCGSTHPEGLQRAVVEHRAQAGLALDGDADRVVAVDETGALVDGDAIMAIAAIDLHARGRLTGGAVVATVMSNLGLRRALAERGIELVETPVGDRHVQAAMKAGGFVLGGEQSGHVIFSELATTGDGCLTGLVLLDAVRRSGRPLSDLAAEMPRFPQVLRNVSVARRDELPGAEAFWRDARAVETELGAEGRVLVRASGTEPVVRVMVEAASEERARAGADRLAAALRSALGAPGASGRP